MKLKSKKNQQQLKDSMNIIFNGHSSSGKTSVLKAFAEKSDELFLRMGIDMLWGGLFPQQYIMFNEKSHLGFALKESENGLETLPGIYGEKMSKVFIESIKLYNNFGFNVVHDDVILCQEDIEKYSILDLKTTFFIGVFCDKKIAMQREKERQNRPLGLVQNQYKKVHQFENYYDLSLNTSFDYEENVKLLINFIKNNNPTGFIKYFESQK